MANGGFITEPIEAGHDATGFGSGVPALDAFLKHHALTNDRRGLGRTFVRRRRPDEDGLPSIVGFYTLCMADIDSSSVPARGLPRYPTPVALIGRLAVDHRAQGRGLGADLLVDALARVMGVEATIGCFGCVVDAKSVDAARFYERFGFVPIGEAGVPRRMFMAMKTIRSAAAGG